MLVLEQPHDRASESGWIAWRDQQTRFAVHDDLWNASGTRGHYRALAHHRIEERGSKPLRHRAHDVDIEALQQREGVGTKPGEQHVLLEVVLLDLVPQLRFELTLTEDREASVRHAVEHRSRRLDEVALTLVRDQRGDVADHGSIRWQPELGPDVKRRERFHVLDIDAAEHRCCQFVGYAVADQH